MTISSATHPPVYGFLLLMANLDWVEFDEKINYPQPLISPDVQVSLTTTD
ncbi:hypothetical protein [Peribacillus muralis]